MKKFKFLTQAGLNYISYKTRELYRYTSVYHFRSNTYMPNVYTNKRWKGFERSFNERLRCLVIRNTINSGLCDIDLDSAIMSITNWIKELRDDSAKRVESLVDKIGACTILKTLPDEKTIEKDVYKQIRHIFDFVMKQREQYIFEQEWKDPY